jgi:hypothetical protein
MLIEKFKKELSNENLLQKPTKGQSITEKRETVKEAVVKKAVNENINRESNCTATSAQPNIPSNGIEEIFDEADMYRQNEEDAPKDSDQARTCECRII